MTAPIRTRLFLSYLAVILLGMGVAIFLSWRLVEALYLDTQRENLLAQAALTAEVYQKQSLTGIPSEPYVQTMNVQPGIHTRLIAEGGAVIFSLPITSEFSLQAPSAENSPSVTSDELLQRPEIAMAMQGEPATSIRHVETAGNRRVLYAAAPVLADDGTVIGLVYVATPLPKAGLPSKTLLNLVGVGCVAVILALAAGSLLSKRIARPIENIAGAVTAVSAGNLNQQVPVDSSIRELNHLGHAFNRMTESLQQSDQAKTAFVADVTHELRTPLTVIKGTIETLEDGALDDIAGRGSLLSSMLSETDRLIRLVNDLLVLTQADAGMLKLDLQPMDLGKLAVSRSDHFKSLASRSKVKVEVKISEQDESCIVLGDADRLAQVLDNLLDNALRYSPEGSTITVTVRRSEDTCECTVQDCGPGIPAQHLPHIFERFYRVDASRNRQTGGAGLGLSIARSLIQSQDGWIGAESTPGEGTSLRFKLPHY
jgi:signal transduction histidine kinase